MKVDEWRCKVEVVSTSDVERIHLSARRASQSRDQQSHLLEYSVYRRVYMGILSTISSKSLPKVQGALDDRPSYYLVSSTCPSDLICFTPLHTTQCWLALLVVAITWARILNIAITLSIKRPLRAHRVAASALFHSHFSKGGRFSDSHFLSQVC